MQDFDLIKIDCYKILGVEPSADRETIVRAYRRRMKECHPDCGGTHREAVDVGTAWKILSDPEARARYDAFRRGGHAISIPVRATTADFERAKEWAEQYPRRWDECESWLDQVSRDFGNANFTPTVVGGGSLRGLPFSVASNSRSGTVFTCCGGAIGALIGAALWYHFPNFGVRNTVLFFMGLVSVGGWAGMMVHQSIGRAIASDQEKQAKPKHQEPTGTVIVPCPLCQQKLRLPRISKFLAITCPACKHQFDLPPAF